MHGYGNIVLLRWISMCACGCFLIHAVWQAVGTIAAEQDGQGEKVVSGLLVQKDFKYQMVAPHDLHLYTHLTTAEVHQRQQGMD